MVQYIKSYIILRIQNLLCWQPLALLGIAEPSTELVIPALSCTRRRRHGMQPVTFALPKAACWWCRTHWRHTTLWSAKFGSLKRELVI